MFLGLTSFSLILALLVLLLFFIFKLLERDRFDEVERFLAFAANGDDMFQIDAIVLEAHGQFVVKMHRDFKFSAAQENLFFLQPVEKYDLCDTLKSCNCSWAEIIFFVSMITVQKKVSNEFHTPGT